MKKRQRQKRKSQEAIHTHLYSMFQRNYRRATLHMFGQGLAPDIYEKCALQNPATLNEWYTAATRVFNTKTRLGSITGSNGRSSRFARDKWAMDTSLDAVIISTLSKEEREKHIKDGLCFI